jgi:hypothetical protein
VVDGHLGSPSVRPAASQTVAEAAAGNQQHRIRRGPPGTTTEDLSPKLIIANTAKVYITNATEFNWCFTGQLAIAR